MSQGNKAVLTLAVFLETMKALVSGSEPLDAGSENTRFVDKWFANEMNRLVLLPQWRLREALA